MGMFRRYYALGIVSCLTLQSCPVDACAWHDRAHLAIAEAAGLDIWYSAAAPDVAKSKAQFAAVESPNHYFNNNAACKVTAAMVLGQAERYNRPGDAEGHLYGAIVGSIRDYQKMKVQGKYARYPLAFCAHYVGDLSMPLHNTAYDGFNKARHSANDGVIEGSVRDNVGFIRRMMRPPVIDSEEALAREVAAVAESARMLGGTLRRENRDMTVEEAYAQVIRSASLLRAILDWTERGPAAPAITTTATTATN